MTAINIYRILRTGVIAIFMPAFVHAQGLSTDTSARIDKLFTRWNRNTPGGVLQVTREGQTIYHNAFGSANLEGGLMNSVETIFEAGSVSKQFTAAAILLLVQEGKIDLNDPVRKYFPDFPEYGNRITVDQLLHHTSGLRDWGSVADIGGWARTTRIYKQEHVREIIWRQTATNFPPGTQFGYSNSNYSLLVFLVEKISGMPFQVFTENRLFKPMGMDHTQWRDNYREIIYGRAQAYAGFANQYTLLMPFENTFGHGGLLTTTEDLSKWNQRWKNAGLGTALNQLQKEKGILANQKTIEYARGVSIRNQNGFEEISHSGSTAGYRAWLAYYPEKSLSIAFLSNDGGTSPTDVGKEVASVFLGQAPEKSAKPTPPFIKTDSLQAKAVAGSYLAQNGNDLQEFVWNDGALRLANNKRALSQSGPYSYHADGFDFIFSGYGKSPETMLLNNARGDTGTYRKVRSFARESASMLAYTGTYTSREADVTITIRLEDTGLVLYRGAGRGMPLKPVDMDIFFTPELERLEFRRDKKHLSGFGWTVSRAHNVWFEKQQ